MKTRYLAILLISFFCSMAGAHANRLVSSNDPDYLGLRNTTGHIGYFIQVNCPDEHLKKTIESDIFLKLTQNNIPAGEGTKTDRLILVTIVEFPSRTSVFVEVMRPVYLGDKKTLVPAFVWDVGGITEKGAREFTDELVSQLIKGHIEANK